MRRYKRAFFLVSWLICRQISEFYQQLLLRLTACFQKKDSEILKMTRGICQIRLLKEYAYFLLVRMRCILPGPLFSV